MMEERGGDSLSETSNRLRKLREGLGISQAKFATIAGTAQATINRYETGFSVPSLRMLMWYADYFDVSMDYLTGRTDKPEGKLYEFKPRPLVENTEMRQFIDMCFDPKSPMHDRLKETLIQMLGEAKE